MLSYIRTKQALSITIIVGFFGFFAVAAFAQNGSVSKSTSSDPLSDPSGISAPAVSALAAPRPAPSPAPIGSVAPVISAPVIPAPTSTAPVVSTTTPTTTVEAAPLVQEQTEEPPVATEPEITPSNIPFIAILVVAMIGLGAYALNRLRAKKKDTDEKTEDDPGCLELKKRMEKKLEELKDIRGQLTDRAKDKAREKVRTTVAGTAAGDLLAQAETLEKQYARLKMLYEQCIAGVSRKKRVFIVHNWSGTPDDGWYPWLQKALQKEGFKVFALSMPDTDKPTIEKWTRSIAEQVGTADKNTFFVGHSIGCQAILRYLEQLPDDAKVGKVVLVAPWLTLTNVNSKEEKDIARPWLETPIDLEKVKEHTEQFFALFSDNDTYVPTNNRALFEQRLGATTVILQGMGHFTEDDGVRELPTVLDRLLK